MSNGSYVKRTWIVENTYRCTHCNTINKGRHMSCTKCGKHLDKNVKYDTSENLTSQEVTDSKLLDLANSGPNWYCSYCNNQVRNKTNNCSVCGAPKDETSFYTKPKKKKNKQTVSTPAQQAASKQFLPLPIDNNTDFRGSFTNYVRNNKDSYKIFGGIFATFAVILGLVWYFFSYHNETATVTRTEWTHHGELEQRYTRSGEGWINNAPSSHFNDSCVTRQHGTHSCNPYSCNPHSVSYTCNCRSVQTGESCSTSCRDNGNGFSSCSQSCTPTYSQQCDTCSRIETDTCYQQCPTMEDWCTYDYYQWKVINVATTHGVNNHNLVDPNLVAKTNSNGPQRVTINRTYSVTLANVNDRSETWNYTPNSATDYNRFVTGHTVGIEVNRAGNVHILSLNR